MEPDRPTLMEFTKADFDTYLARMAHYDKKVDEGDMLSEEDVNHLKDMRMELWQRYTQNSLSQYHIVGCINSILSLDDVRKTHKWGIESEEEAKCLELELSKMEREGTLTPKIRDRLYRRIDDIHRNLDPTHFHDPHY